MNDEEEAEIARSIAMSLERIAQTALRIEHKLIDIQCELVTMVDGADAEVQQH